MAATPHLRSRKNGRPSITGMDALVRLRLDGCADEWRAEATHDGELVGSFSFQPVSTQPVRLRLTRAYCDLAGERSTGQGIGTALLWHARQVTTAPIEVGTDVAFTRNGGAPDDYGERFIRRGVELGLLTYPRR
jgi:hypothetical protein